MDTRDDVVVEEKIVNFLDMSQKKHDWRYKTYSTLKKETATKTIYWIATVFLSEVSEKGNRYNLHYFRNGHLIEDGESIREVDGGLTSGYTKYLFNLSEFKPEMLKAKSEGRLFYSIFIEETVNNFGCHQVYGLYNNKQGEPAMYGITSFTPWYKMSVDHFLDVAHFNLDENIERVLLLGQGSYTWLK